MKHFIFILILLFCLYPCLADLKIVVNKDSKFSSLTRYQLKKIYTGRLKKVNNEKIQVSILKKGPLREEFLKEYVGMTNPRFKRHWAKMVFTGKAKAPKSISSEKKMLIYTQANPSAIGLLSDSSVTGNVLILRIE